MNQIARNDAATTGGFAQATPQERRVSIDDAGGAPTRFYYADPFRHAGGVAAAARHAAALGFDALVAPPLFQPGRDGDRFVAGSLDKGHPGLGIAGDPVAALAAACREAGIAAFMDLVLDRVGLAGLPADAPFQPLRATGTMDPRHPIEPGVSWATVSSPADAERLAAWWAGWLGQWRQAGLGGVRLLGLDRLPHAGAVVAGLRRACPELCLLAWTPGLPRETLTLLEGTGLDLVAGSLPWWDWSSDWFWTELDALRRIAPVVLGPEAPFGVRLSRIEQTTGARMAAFRRAVAFAAFAGDALMLVDGAEQGAPDALDAWQATPDPQTGGLFDLGPEIARLNRLAPHGVDTRVIPLSSPDAAVMALLRPSGGDARDSKSAMLLLLNRTLDRPAVAAAGSLLPRTGGLFGPFQPVLPGGGTPFTPDQALRLAPGEACFLTADTLPLPARPVLDGGAAVTAAKALRLAIEAPSPCVDDGRFPARRTLGELVTVEADLVADGHDRLAAVVRWRTPSSAEWHEEPMVPLGNDRWTASLPLEQLGVHEYDIHAWRDDYATYRNELGKKHEAGVPVTLELIEGRAHVAAAASRSAGALSVALNEVLASFDAAGSELSAHPAKVALLLSPDTEKLMQRADHRPHLTRLERPIPVECERTGAGFASWYEVFPRSLSDDPDRHGTFRDVERHLPRVAAMGFDVLYFPPFHPIGQTNRKGRNNSLRAEPGDPGSPYAIGSDDGGHDALHPELGTLDDLEHLRQAAAAHGLELAMDFAIQCSPDHPWLKQHKDWFSWRPDGSMRYAENPPKRYEDIVNVDFYAPGAVPGLWVALCEAVLFWASRGIRLFRVDNPHTKPLPFWHWMIAEVKRRYPDSVFLAEAFTRPKVMYRLAKVGFSQSYTYFTWRTEKWEFEQYLTELTRTPPREFFRPHFFVNTPDINPTYLHTESRPMFLCRAALAATLSGLWGVYNGFELCEGKPDAKLHEYADSEKYQLRAWDWDRPGNIVAEVTALNRIRRLNPALHSHLGIEFLEGPGPEVLYFEKATPDRSNVLLVAISMAPATVQEADIALPFWRWDRNEGDAFDAYELVGGGRETWRGKWHHIRLTPEQPYAIWRVRPAD